MARSFQLNRIEKLVALDQSFLFTLTSYVLILSFYINSNIFQSPVIGFAIFVPYFLINAIFLAHVFFEKEDLFTRLMFGVLLQIMLLGFVGWLIMIIYSLDAVLFSITLLVTASISSLLNRRIKHRNVTR